MDPAKIQAIKEWATPQNVRQVQSFLGFCNFYRRFIKGFAKIAEPLTKLTKKDEPFQWTPACDQAFRKFKKRVTTAPVLRHFDPKENLSWRWIPLTMLLVES